MQQKQATGLDTRMMMPAYAAVFALIAQWFLPWISVPALRYSRLPTTYTVYRLNSLLENFQAAIASGEQFTMPPLTEAQLQTLTGIALGMKIAAVLMTVLLAAVIFGVLRYRSRSMKPVRAVFFCNFLYGLASAALVLAGNILLNRAMGRANGFLNLSLYSYLQATSWIYGQILISLGIFFGAGKLMDVSRESRPQTYVERTLRQDRGMKTRTKVTLLLIVVAIPLVIFFGIFFLNDRSNVFIGLCIVCLAMVPFAMVFEDREPQARELLLIAVISAIAVVGRTAFFMLPQFKPVTAIVIIAGIGLGAEAGFLTGAVSGFVSNFFFGQGPWTPWQMFAYGIIGFLAGLLFSRRCAGKIRTKKGERRYLAAVCTYGAFATFFIYGFIMDFSTAINFTQQFSWQVLMAKLISGIPFNLVHGASTVVFLLFLARPFQRKLDRIKKKYGIMEV